MCRSTWLVVGALAGCGRLGFDASAMTDDGGGSNLTDSGDSIDASPLLDSCVVHLSMDEASWSGAPTDAANTCGGLSGRAVGGASVVSDPTRGRVGEFVGDPSCLELGDAPSVRPTDQLTMTAWIYPTGLDGTTPYGIISKREAFQLDSQYTMFLWTNDVPYVDLDSEDDRFGTSVAATNGVWFQLTVVYDGRLQPAERVRVYRNGVLEYTAFESSATIATLSSRLTVGCMPDPPLSSISFVGRLDEVAIWTRALDASEVAQWYAATL